MESDVAPPLKPPSPQGAVGLKIEVRTAREIHRSRRGAPRLDAVTSSAR